MCAVLSFMLSPLWERSVWAGGQLGPITCVPCKHKDFGSIPRSHVRKRKVRFGATCLHSQWWRGKDRKSPGIGRPDSQWTQWAFLWSVGLVGCFLMSGTAAEERHLKLTSGLQALAQVHVGTFRCRNCVLNGTIIPVHLSYFPLTRSHFVAQDGLEFVGCPRLALNSRQFSHLSLKHARITDLGHHAWLSLYFYFMSIWSLNTTSFLMYNLFSYTPTF